MYFAMGEDFADTPENRKHDRRREWGWPWNIKEDDR